MKPDLEQLLCSYQRGDTAAAAALVHAVSPMFVRFCLANGDHPQEVDDILQDIWMRVHRARRTYRPGAPAEPWLYAIARNTRLDAWRRRARIRARELRLEVLPEVAAPVQNVSPMAVSELLEVLPQAQREVLMLLKGCGMTLEEVARATSSTVGAVKQKAYRAYCTLRAVVQTEQKGQP